jgi:DNA-binding MarR family transcriptional regulator
MNKPALPRRMSLGYQVNHAARLFAQSLRARIEPHGVVPGQFAQLLALYEEEGLTQQQLCERVGIDPSTMAHTLKRMERDGLVRRRPDPDDRRRAVVTLTPRARSLEPVLTQAARDVNALATRGIPKRDVSALLVTVSTLIANLDDDPEVEKGR